MAVGSQQCTQSTQARWVLFAITPGWPSLAGLFEQLPNQALADAPALEVWVYADVLCVEDPL